MALAYSVSLSLMPLLPDHLCQYKLFGEMFLFACTGNCFAQLQLCLKVMSTIFDTCIAHVFLPE